MQDVVFIGILIAFFGLAVLFVRGVRADHRAGRAGCARGGCRGRTPAGGGVTAVESVVGLVLAVLIGAYLVYALLAPEKL